MSEMNCEDTKRHVHEYLHSELDATEIELITAHLANCDSCEGDYDFENLFNSVIQRSCDEVPPQELGQRILSRIRDINSGAEH
jgi:mycothiol system anti-sigma-R factor